MLVETEIRPSPIHGMGCFTLEPIERGDVVWVLSELDKRFSKHLLWSREVLRLLEHYAYFDAQLDAWILPVDDARFMNHSDEPNLTSSWSSDVAARDIAAGEELTCDYRTFDTDWKRKLGR